MILNLKLKCCVRRALFFGSGLHSAHQKSPALQPRAFASCRRKSSPVLFSEFFQNERFDPKIQRKNENFEKIQSGTSYTDRSPSICHFEFCVSFLSLALCLWSSQDLSLKFSGQIETHLNLDPNITFRTTDHHHHHQQQHYQQL